MDGRTDGWTDGQRTDGRLGGWAGVWAQVQVEQLRPGLKDIPIDGAVHGQRIGRKLPFVAVDDVFHCVHRAEGVGRHVLEQQRNEPAPSFVMRNSSTYV